MQCNQAIDFAKPFADAVWCDVVPRAAVCPELSSRVLLHAGPPYRGAPPTPVFHAATQAILFEGLAADATAARELMLQGQVELRPAQDHGIVTPLAQVVSASMLLVAVRQRDQISYAPIVEGPAPALRFGSPAPEALQRLRDLSIWIRASVAPLVRRHPVSIFDIIRAAVAAGDECHGRTGVANEDLVSRLRGVDSKGAELLRANPAFVLAPLMAAAAAAMQFHRSPIQAIGGNGIDFGVRRRGEAIWRQLPADAPRGIRPPSFDSSAPLPAIGDSAVIDFCGLGGQALGMAPQLMAEWREMLPADVLTRREAFIDHSSGIVDPERVARQGSSPLINLAILDRDGVKGLLGRGIYTPPPGLFCLERHRVNDAR
jgi:Protein of unknown function (DUF1116)